MVHISEYSSTPQNWSLTVTPMGYRMMKNVYLKHRCRHKKITKSTYINKGEICLDFLQQIPLPTPQTFSSFLLSPPWQFVKSHQPLLIKLMSSLDQRSWSRVHSCTMEALCSSNQRKRYENTKWLLETLWVMGGLIGRVSDSRYKNPGFKPQAPSGAQETFVSFSESKMLCWLAVGVPNPHVYTHTYEWSHIRMLKIL